MIFRLFFVDVDCVVEFLHCIDVGCFADVSEVHAASILIVSSQFLAVEIKLLAKCYTGSSPENLKRKDHFGDIGVDGSIILKWILKKQAVSGWTGWVCLGIWTSGGLL
jgi:hypothetical protein